MLGNYGVKMVMTNSASNRESSKFNVDQRPSSFSRAFATAKASTLKDLPKRPKTTYFLFLEKLRPDFAKQNPDLKPAQIIKHLATMFNEISPAEKKKLQDEYEKNKVVYQQQMKQFAALHPRSEVGIRFLKTQRKNDVNRPKRPLSGFFRFSQEQRPTIPAGTSATDTARMLGEMWRSLGPAKQARYNEAYRSELPSYKEAKNHLRTREP
jgi:hypothetical protein